MTEKSKKTVGVGILSWKSYETLQNSLQSYPPEFLRFFQENMIYFSDLSHKDIEIAEKFGWNHCGGENKGIAAGMKNLAQNIHTDYILLLQNDNPLCIKPDLAIKQIEQVVDLLEHGQADLARMRHRWNVGEGFCDVNKYLKYYDTQNISSDYIPDHHNHPKTTSSPFKKLIRRLLKPSNAKRFQGRSIFIEENPDTIYPEAIQRKGDFFILDSSVLDFTDQCLLISREKWLDHFIPHVEKKKCSIRSCNGFIAPELCINGRWWRKGNYKIIQGEGCFTHKRFDGSFRNNHWTMKDKVKKQLDTKGI